MLLWNLQSSFVTKLHVAAFLWKIAARDPAFGRWMRLAFVMAIAREAAKGRYWLADRRLRGSMVIAFNAAR
jgi:hypothetical protein